MTTIKIIGTSIYSWPIQLWNYESFYIFRDRDRAHSAWIPLRVSMSLLPWVFMIIIKDRLSVRCKLSHSNGNSWSDWKAFALKKEYPPLIIWQHILAVFSVCSVSWHWQCPLADFLQAKDLRNLLHGGLVKDWVVCDVQRMSNTPSQVKLLSVCSLPDSTWRELLFGKCAPRM